MVQVGTFYVDSTEVTVGQYLEFLDKRREDTGGQPSVCSWNTSFYNGTPTNPTDWPITNVDWCDARAFCADFRNYAPLTELPALRGARTLHLDRRRVCGWMPRDR